ncbi:hypothetical protein GLOIN_2v1471925 [Rhizophagus irregularis DAOM 181602=DAOM 197198]|uniref:Uncharacterized protein n=1 Tax=Rhizophagus irregularis (strain DAOM 181602 / DAOM 197198 / MUCL 43194) TaxID=747089 RepID=A0A2P4QQK5_RHIID|nr:hypothetical protein GLOIN_2v1471925 [Rhizophagus irregularis DAOM 181602=DAOM 197198]POG79910.1 hypothetical protein GLOIN_2v1471925 [Rhizophagus irregularis DAOM 181602=DAOM 197198]|eukprot:XP_025186776.1 hypothetical protein GLOIN_2v1471925 [Rhizophagus irregularis DAOM 181602=DAOM 197198]
MHFGKYDQKLIELKIEHNVGQLDADRIRAFQQKIKSPWASNLPIIVFTYLLDEGYKQLANMMKPYRQVFHFLSAGPHVINYAPSMLRKNLKDKEDLILNKWFVPFPPRPKAYQLDLNSDSHIHQQPIPEEYPSKDGFENNRQLNVIAKGILIHPDLMNLWKQIGYYEIYDLVMQGALLILFPPTPASDWSYPSIEIGDFLWDAFLAIRSGENVYLLAHLPSNARAAEITIITATNTKKQLICLGGKFQADVLLFPVICLLVIRVLKKFDLEITKLPKIGNISRYYVLSTNQILSEETIAPNWSCGGSFVIDTQSRT